MRQVRYRPVKGGWGQEGSQAKSKMRNFISDRAPRPVNAWSLALIEVFHFPTGVQTCRSMTLLWDICHLWEQLLFFFYPSSVSSKNSTKDSGRFLAQATKAIRQLYGADSNQNESICPICQPLPAVAGASCLAAELSGLRCLAPFSPLSRALKGLATALFCFLPVGNRSCILSCPTMSKKQTFTAHLKMCGVSKASNINAPAGLIIEFKVIYFNFIYFIIYLFVFFNFI